MATLQTGDIFPVETVQDIFSKVKGHSTLAKLTTREPIPFSGTETFVFNLEGNAEIVGEGNPSNAGSATMKPKVIKPILITYQARVSEEFVHCSEEKQLSYLKSFIDGLSKKVAQAIDIASFHGLEPKSMTDASFKATNSFDGLITGNVVAYEASKIDENIDAAVAVGLFYGAGLFYGQRSPLPVMEYWRWWVVHLWVEGFFEVFATASLAFVFVSLGLVSKRFATFSTLASASLFLVGGIPGTFHHLYFAGTTTPIMAVGASFSALEVVPLVLLGAEAYEHYRLQFAQTWAKTLKWPLYCFIAVAFWNMLGAGVFGFLINPPISLFYIQGLNTTPVHGHAALFGVYGFLALGFVWLVATYLFKGQEFDEKLMKVGFWGLNIGLMLMIVLSLLPIGIYQAFASLEHGMWYARSAELLQQSHLQNLRWVRMIGDTILIIGGISFLAQLLKFMLNKKA